jgi:hypothetical protein
LKEFLHIHEIISSLTNPFILYSIIMLDHSKSDITFRPFIWYHYINHFIIYHPINPLSKTHSFYLLIWHPSNALDMFHKISMGFGVFWYEASFTNVVWFLNLNIYKRIVDFESILKCKNQNLQIPIVSNFLDYQFLNLKQPISLKFKVTFEF